MNWCSAHWMSCLHYSLTVSEFFAFILRNLNIPFCHWWSMLCSGCVSLPLPRPPAKAHALKLDPHHVALRWQDSREVEALPSLGGLSWKRVMLVNELVLGRVGSYPAKQPSMLGHLKGNCLPFCWLTYEATLGPY